MTQQPDAPKEQTLDISLRDLVYKLTDHWLHPDEVAQILALIEADRNKALTNLANAVMDSMNEFGDDPAQCLAIISEYISPMSNQNTHEHCKACVSVSAEKCCQCKATLQSEQKEGSDE